MARARACCREEIVTPGRMSKADFLFPAESVYSKEYLVQGEVREGTGQLFNRRASLLI